MCFGACVLGAGVFGGRPSREILEICCVCRTNHAGRWGVLYMTIPRINILHFPVAVAGSLGKTRRLVRSVVVLI